jgi:hypothetical protein
VLRDAPRGKKSTTGGIAMSLPCCDSQKASRKLT